MVEQDSKTLVDKFREDIEYCCECYDDLPKSMPTAAWFFFMEADWPALFDKALAEKDKRIAELEHRINEMATDND